jgi:hypothetical protein
MKPLIVLLVSFTISLLAVYFIYGHNEVGPTGTNCNVSDVSLHNPGPFSLYKGHGYDDTKFYPF